MEGGSCINVDTTYNYPASSGSRAWWYVDLGQEYDVVEVKIYTRSEPAKDQGIEYLRALITYMQFAHPCQLIHRVILGCASDKS